MEYIETVINNVHDDLIHKLSIHFHRPDFIETYNKYNYKKPIIYRGDIMHIYKKQINKYRKIYASIIIQTYYKQYKLRLKS